MARAGSPSSEWTPTAGSATCSPGRPSERLSRCSRERVSPGTLRPYQERGLAWLAFLGRLGLGGVLADDMGLGKTVQLLALIGRRPAGRRTDAAGLPDVAGRQLAARGGAVRAAPAGARAPRRRAGPRRGVRRRPWPAPISCSPPTPWPRATPRRWPRSSWHRVVVDEAQAIKNAATQGRLGRPQTACGTRIAVTGTPVENRLADLWSIMEFVNPGLLGTADDVQAALRHADRAARRRGGRAAAAAAHQPVRAAPAEDRPLDHLRSAGEDWRWRWSATSPRSRPRSTRRWSTTCWSRIEDAAEGIERRGLVLATMTKLKQVCNHPAHLLRDGSALDAADPASWPRLEEMLEEVLAAGEKALLFTQYARVRRHAASPPDGALRPRGARSCTAAYRKAAAGRHGGPVPGGRASPVAVRALAQGRWHRPEPDRGQPRVARRPLVEPGGGGPGDRPGVPDRPAARRSRSASSSAPARSRSGSRR